MKIIDESELPPSGALHPGIALNVRVFLPFLTALFSIFRSCCSGGLVLSSISSLPLDHLGLGLFS